MIFFFRVSRARNTESIPSRDSKMSRASTAISYFKYVKIVSILTIRSTLEIKWTHPLASLNREKPGLYFFSFSVHARFPETTGTRQKFVMFFILFNGGRFSGVEVDTFNTVDNHIVPFNIQYTQRMSGFNDFVPFQIYYTSPRKEPFCTPTVRTVTPNSAGGYWKESRCIHRRTLANM